MPRRRLEHLESGEDNRSRLSPVAQGALIGALGVGVPACFAVVTTPIYVGARHEAAAEETFQAKLAEGLAAQRQQCDDDRQNQIPTIQAKAGEVNTGITTLLNEIQGEVDDFQTFSTQLATLLDSLARVIDPQLGLEERFQGGQTALLTAEPVWNSTNRFIETQTERGDRLAIHRTALETSTGNLQTSMQTLTEPCSSIDQDPLQASFMEEFKKAASLW